MVSKLPENIRAALGALPESGFGVQVVDVVLADGREYSSVHIAWASEIVRVEGSPVVPFDAADVVAVQQVGGK